MTFKATWVELGEVLYLTIAREAKSLGIASADDLLAFGLTCKNVQGRMLIAEDYVGQKTLFNPKLLEIVTMIRFVMTMF